MSRPRRLFFLVLVSMTAYIAYQIWKAQPIHQSLVRQKRIEGSSSFFRVVNPDAINPREVFDVETQGYGDQEPAATRDTYANDYCTFDVPSGLFIATEGEFGAREITIRAKDGAVLHAFVEPNKPPQNAKDAMDARLSANPKWTVKMERVGQNWFAILVQEGAAVFCEKTQILGHNRITLTFRYGQHDAANYSDTVNMILATFKARGKAF